MPPRIPISRELVLDTALRLANEQGVDGLTMRALAAELNIEAPSLYKHVANKNEILDGMCELIYGQVTVEPTGPEWDQRLKTYARAFRSALLANRNLVGTLATRPVNTEASMLLVEVSLQEFTNAGLDPETSRRLLNIAVSTIIGHVLAEVGSPAPGAAEFDQLEKFRATLDPDLFPLSRATVAETPVDRDAEFELALDVLVAGVSTLFHDRITAPASNPAFTSSSVSAAS
jgi:AcrR family transcriptional regulator